MVEPSRSNPFLQAGDEDVSAIADVARVRALLVTAATRGRAVSYSEFLSDLGLRFTRPRMRALCRTLDAIDGERAAGAPELAVLVVRESDGLPGQGWWANGHALSLGHEGPWQGPEAAALVARLQHDAFRWWQARRGATPDPGHTASKDTGMAKSQKKSSKEARKPKAEKPPKPNASKPSTKGTPVAQG